jgi:DNA-binding NtrC family response regulator
MWHGPCSTFVRFFFETIQGNAVEQSKANILIVETDAGLRATLAQHIRQHGMEVSEADCAAEVGQRLSASDHQLVLVGLEGLKREGLSIIRLIRDHFPEIKIITLNTHEQLDLSIEGMRLGAYDDFLIPFNIDNLILCIRKALSAPSRRSPIGRS